MKRLLQASLLGVSAPLVATAAEAAPVVYAFSGTVSSFSDPGHLLGLSNVVGSMFEGSVSTIPVGSPTDYISDVTVAGGALVVGTPNDGAVPNTYNGTTSFYVLPYNPVIFTTSAGSQTCQGDGSVQLLNGGTMSFNIGCTSYQFNGNPSPGFRISGFGSYAVSGGVPEPATWAMMLLGFGGLGYTMRRRPGVRTRSRLV